MATERSSPPSPLRRAAGGAIHRAGRLLDELLPPACAVCRAPASPGPPLCGVCESRLRHVPRPRCHRCGAPRTSGLDGEACVYCDPWPEGLEAAASAVLHEPPADRLVAGLKYAGWTALAPRLAEHMVEPARALRRRLGADPLLAAVPLDRRGARRRGFNQAALLADRLAALTGWAQVTDGLARRATPRRQAELGRAERLENVLAAFHWRPGVAMPERPILLVDDVLTTGSTAAACAVAVREAGGRCAGVVTFARALPSPDGG